jgi:hypothetical protein
LCFIIHLPFYYSSSNSIEPTLAGQGRVCLSPKVGPAHILRARR